MAPAARERLADRPLVLAEDLPVAVVELLDHLERPAAGQDVAADELALDPRGELAGARGTHALERLVELEVGLPDELVEGVQVAAGALERLGHPPGGGDGVVSHLGTYGAVAPE